ncbi:MAG TPA: polymer-forming cytoskeletal protein [Vicinamibacterales bacterium]|nr:polymer-forming cytoskeletal protein [Vicinamibacterales bacterium]
MTTLGRTIVAAGELTSEEDVTIHGRVSGQIVVRDATLVVAETARVDADVRAARIVIRGELNGTVVAGERIVLDATASVTGSLSADRVVIADGARFDGRIDMDRRTIAMKVAQYKDQRAHAT